MTDVRMQRASYTPEPEGCQHAGLFLLMGFKKWQVDCEDGETQDTNGEDSENQGAENSHGQERSAENNHNKDIAEHHQHAAKILPDIYSQAYARWKEHLIEQGESCGHWFGQLVGRMYLGLGETSPLDAGITLHHTYGVPFIPGSAIKGVLHHFAMANGMGEGLRKIIFGVEPEPDKGIDAEAGYVIFNDAWWIPGKRNPLAPEVVTVHHENYYSSGGQKPATDFDDPNPNPQIAIRGSFHFSFFADESLHSDVMELLVETLQHSGVGGKVSSGYGVFSEDTKAYNDFTTHIDKLKNEQDEADRKAEMSSLELKIHEIEKSYGTSADKVLLDSLEDDDQWPDSESKSAVAKRVMEIMKEKKQWMPNSDGKTKRKAKFKERSLKVLSYLLDRQESTND